MNSIHCCRSMVQTRCRVTILGWDQATKTATGGISKEVFIADADLQIHNLFKKYIEYSGAENLAGVMATVDPSSSGYAQIEMQLSQLFTVYDMYYEATIEILDLQEESAVVLTTITTSKVSGPDDYDDNQVVSTHRIIPVH